MRSKFDNLWVECRNPIDLMDHPSNMQIGLCCYQKGPNDKRTCDHIDHLMVDLGITSALASMTCIANLYAYESRQGGRKVFNKYI